MDELKKKYPHLDEVDKEIIDEIIAYLDNFCGYGGEKTEEFDKGFSQAVDMAKDLVNHFSKED